MCEGTAVDVQRANAASITPDDGEARRGVHRAGAADGHCALAVSTRSAAVRAAPLAAR